MLGYAKKYRDRIFAEGYAEGFAETKAEYYQDRAYAFPLACGGIKAGKSLKMAKIGDKILKKCKILTQ